MISKHRCCLVTGNSASTATGCSLIVCLSTDIKPTGHAGCTLIESNTAKVFKWSGSAWTEYSAGGGAKAVVFNLLNHFTTLENTTSANAAWKIPAATTYGQVALHFDMTKLGTPASATFFAAYTNTAASGTNQIGLVLGNAPVAAGTTVTPIASSVVTLANSATYPQTITKAITPAELGSTARWLQWCLNLASSSVGPNVMSAGLILYY